MNRTRSAVLGLLVFAAGMAVASQTVLIPLEDDCEPVQRVVQATVDEAVTIERHMTLADGSPGPVIEWQYDYTCSNVEVLAGEPLGETKLVRVKYALTSPTCYDVQGQALVTKSLIRSGSGLEPQLEKGRRYLLLFSTAESAAGPHRLHRAELPERLVAVQDAMARARCWRALRPVGVVRESVHSAAWESAQGVLYASVRRAEESDVYRAEQATGLVGKATVTGLAAQFERLAAQSDGVLLMGSGYEPHGKTLARVLRAEEFRPVGK